MLEPYKCCNSDSHLCSGFNTAFRPSFRDVPRQATAMTSIQRPGWPAMWFLVPRCRNHLPRFSVFVWTDIRILENMEKFSEIQKISSELDEVSKFTRYFLKDFGDVVVSGPQVLLHGPSPRGRTRFCKAGLMGWWSMGNWDQHVFFSSGWNNTTWMFWMIPENWMVYIYICSYNLPASNFVWNCDPVPTVKECSSAVACFSRISGDTRLSFGCCLRLIEDDHIFLRKSNSYPVVQAYGILQSSISEL